MYSRSDLKFEAKEMLRKHYWKALLVTLIAAILAGKGNSWPSIDYSFSRDSFNGLSRTISIPFIWTLFGGIIIIGISIGIAFSIFVSGPIIVGKTKFFIEAYKDEDIDVGLIGFAFSNNYMNIIKTMFLKYLYIFLWSLLFIIPGIIKSYAYKMVPYILADNPDMDYQEVLELSKEMTDGHKFDIFVLELSFIGWYLLGALALGVGILFVMPYAEATYSGLYNYLKDTY